MAARFHGTALWLARLVAGLVVLVAPLPAQDPPAPPPSAEFTAAAVQASLDALAADQAIEADRKAALVELYGKALAAARNAETSQQAAAAYAAQQTTAAARLAQRQQELETLDAQRPRPPQPGLSLADLEQGLAAAQKTLADAQRQAQLLDAQRAARAERRTAIPKLLADQRERLDALPGQPADAPDADPRLVHARRAALFFERQQLQASIQALTAELATLEAETELVRAENDLAARRTTQARAEVDAWLAALLPLREAEAQRAEAEARAEAVRADPRIASLAQENARLAAAKAQLADELSRAERDRASRSEKVQRMRQQYDEVRRRVELVGATDAIGALLRQQRAQLSFEARQFVRETRSRSSWIANAQLRSIEFEERRQRIVENPEAWLSRELGGEELVATLPADLVAEARRLRESQRALLRDLTTGYANLLGIEVEVDTLERERAALLERHQAYVAERVLGIRSSPPVWRLDWRALAAATAWLIDAPHWAQLGALFAAGASSDGWPILLAAPLIALLLLRLRFRRMLARTGERAARGTNVAYAPTALAAIATALLALPVPLLLVLCGGRLAVYGQDDPFAKSVAAGMQNGAIELLVVLFLRQLVRPGGLAEIHFQWQSTTLALLRRAGRLLLFSVVPCSFVLDTLEARGEDAWLGSLGSLVLLVQLALMLAAFGILLHPGKGLIGSSLRAPGTAWHRLRLLWFLSGTGAPLALATLSVLGYDYTAVQFLHRIHSSLAAIVGGVFVYAMVERSLLLVRRRLQMERVQQRLAAASTAAGGDTAAALPAAPKEELDPQSLTRQSQAVLGSAAVLMVAIAILQIWADVMPALAGLRRVTLWNLGTDMAPQIVSLADLLLGLFVLLASIAAARNLPALLELLVLQRLAIRAGERYAITTLVRYLIVIAGVIWAFSSLGIGWSKLQWLVAAVSVGLGFGLQEIFANFVSGLILLFERPIRVGDIVTINQTIGRVTRIRIRATTILDWDRKELVVPNREFVSQQFVNWTLGDPIVRWIVRVGVPHGTDTDRALPLLVAAAYDCRFVLKEPPAQAYFVRFGEHALDLELRLFLDIQTVEWTWITDVHQAICRRFAAAGIRVALPQRDVHLRLDQPALDALRPRQAERAVP